MAKKRARKITKPRRRRAPGPRAVPTLEIEAEAGEVPTPLGAHREVSPVESGGDVDADWQAAQSTGEETVGGSVATPDQDVVEEIGRALGVDQPADAPVTTSEEILRARDRHYWHLERDAAKGEES